ncbi:Nucleotide-binding alpha-beta plait domain-containing protein [Dioscorea alata]|uniref:Nucleotide-binding alpha-beta plait domain-containing protein n=1 Tax=Dioscorea alata TaxID=55571 RepID=A0ACB7VU98_DIOAL|nr:Nucleotide-binding alpha-beta plait domain-containing protein [Dioscorea alata]
MTKVSLLRNALRSRVSSLNSLPRFLPSRSLSADPFLEPPTDGLVFAKLSGIGRNTLKTDVINFFEGCHISPGDIKVLYNRAYSPVGMILQFPSRSAFDMAVRQSVRKGRLYRLDKVDRSQWDELLAYNGKAIVLQGIPRNTTFEDVERFLTGFNYDPSTLQLINRPGMAQTMRVAIAHFHSRIDAMNAYVTKNRSFCLNSPVTVRFLQ